MKTATTLKSIRKNKKCPKHWGGDYWNSSTNTEKSDLARLNLEFAYELASKKVDEHMYGPRPENFHNDIFRWYMYFSMLVVRNKKELKRSLAHNDAFEFVEHQRKLNRLAKRREMEREKLKWASPAQPKSNEKKSRTAIVPAKGNRELMLAA